MTAQILCCLIALLHLYFLVLEMFLWTKPKGLKVFRQTLDQALSTRVMAANQGLYNGFLAAGLIWAAFAPNPSFAFELRIFFLGCVVLAGALGGASVSRKIFWVQGAPAVLGLVAVVLSR